MFDDKQLVKRKCTNTRTRYKNLGYDFDDKGYAMIRACDLTNNSDAKVVATCDYCGNTYMTQYSTVAKNKISGNKDCCSACAPEKANDLRRIREAKQKISAANAICLDNGYKLLTTESEYNGVINYIQFECSVHGVQKMPLSNLLKGHKCIVCSYESRGRKLRHSEEYIEKHINSVNGNTLLNVDEYLNTFERNLRIKCACGNEYVTSFSNFTKANVNRCSKCSAKESSGEYKIRSRLDQLNISYQQEQRFPDCKDIKPLPFDFFLPDLNLCIEFDGEQHFRSLSHEDKHDFERRKRHDSIKDEYCKSNNIYLLRIPYWDIDNINTIIDNQLDVIQVKDIV